TRDTTPRGTTDDHHRHHRATGTHRTSDPPGRLAGRRSRAVGRERIPHSLVSPQRRRCPPDHRRRGAGRESRSMAGGRELRTPERRDDLVSATQPLPRHPLPRGDPVKIADIYQAARDMAPTGVEQALTTAWRGLFRTEFQRHTNEDDALAALRALGDDG